MGAAERPHGLCSQRLEAGRGTASKRYRPACAGASLSKTVLGVGLCRMRDGRCYPGAPRRPPRRRLGLRLHRETGRILCGLLAIASVSVLTLLLLHCPLFAVLRGGPADQHVTMHAGRPPLFAVIAPNQKASLRAQGCRSSLSSIRPSAANLPARPGLPLRKGEA